MNHRASEHDIPLHFYATANYPCSYLEDKDARSQVAVPTEAINTQTYSQLVRLGFRRSGLFIYRPYCDDCKQCIAVRLPVIRFQASRSQRRAAARHQDLTTRIVPLAFYEAHYALYARYQSARHAGGTMADDDRNQYAEFILKSHVSSYLVEFFEGDTLRMVSLIDQLDDGLSAVYTFFEPDMPQASYGVYNVLWQIAECKRLGLPYLYLGYWVNHCRKMAYKMNFQPLEQLVSGRWKIVIADSDTTKKIVG